MNNKFKSILSNNKHFKTGISLNGIIVLIVIIVIIFLIFSININKKKDINVSNTNKVDKYCSGFVIPQVGCVVNIGKNYDASGKFYFEQTNTEYSNYWQGAKDKCASMNMSLPNIETLNSIYNFKGKLAGVPTSGAYLSSDEYDSFNAKYLFFGGDKSFVYYHFKGNQTDILCVQR